MTDEQRQTLDPNSAEYRTRITGSKIQLAGWSSYSALLWTLKFSLLVFYTRLTAGLGRGYITRIYFGFGLLLATYTAGTLNLFLGCRPFHKNWQIYPNPGNECQPAISNGVVWVFGSLNVVTDLYLISIPLPMLWQSSLKPVKKFGLIILFSGGIFVIVCALLRAVFIVTDPVNGAQQAGSWAVRETFVAVITTNLPLVFPFIRVLLTPVFSGLAQSVRGSADKKTLDGTPRSIITWGGGNKQNWRNKASRTANPITDLTFSESEERMLAQGGQFKMHEMTSNTTKIPEHRADGNNIIKQVEIAQTSMPRNEENQQSTCQNTFRYAVALPPQRHPTYSSSK
ncbi:hypothetical protein GGR54DRAFT_284512 [Hypoxylon sp. NC1633]|nr:hypothetical protein GGR54DRAFT_284512 [Hypoxylon sp. NC1633]